MSDENRRNQPEALPEKLPRPAELLQLATNLYERAKADLDANVLTQDYDYLQEYQLLVTVSKAVCSKDIIMYALPTALPGHYQGVPGRPGWAEVNPNVTLRWLVSQTQQLQTRLAQIVKERAQDDSAEREPVRLFDSLRLHPLVARVARHLFVDGHYAQAIFEAFKAVNNMVKDKSGLVDLDGKQLMARAFDESRPAIKVSQLRDRTEKDEQEGFKFLFMGSTLGIRNPKAHAETAQSDPFHALHYLAFASVLAMRVDEAAAEPP